MELRNTDSFVQSLITEKKFFNSDNGDLLALFQLLKRAENQDFQKLVFLDVREKTTNRWVYLLVKNN
jgi:hypothetical protein